MITYSDVKLVVIESKCRDSCTHSARVTFNDGTTRVIPPSWIYAVIAGLEDGRINPNLNWKGAEVKRHFKDHAVEEWVNNASSEILNSIFSNS